MSPIDQAVHRVRADAADDAKLDQLLAGLGVLTTTITTLTKRLDSVETEMKKSDGEPMLPVESKDESGEKLDKIMDHLTGLHAKHDALKTSCDTLNTKHDAMSARQDEMSGKYDALAKKVDEMGSNEEPTQASAEPAPPAIDSVTSVNGGGEPANKVAADAAAATRMQGLEKIIADMQKRLPAEIPADQKDRFTAAQARWEKIAQMFGDSDGAPRCMNGESLSDYQRRLVGKYKQHSKVWKDKDLDQVPDTVLDIAIEQVHADAQAAALTPAPTSDGVLTSREFRDPMTGRMTRKFYGDINVMLRPFQNPRRYVKRFMTPGAQPV